jgi:hypothetical protein
MNFTTVAHCGTDHAAWLKSVAFYEGEFDSMNERLMEIASKNTGVETMAEVEHFQNQFIIQRNNMDELKHQVREHDLLVSQEARQHSGKMDSGNATVHNNVKEAFSKTEEIINNLRKEFNQFLSRTM